MSKLIDAMKNMDWTLLRKQKERLVAMANDEDRLTSEIEALDGIIQMIDAIQDAVVDDQIVSVIEVFGELQGYDE